MNKRMLYMSTIVWVAISLTLINEILQGRFDLATISIAFAFAISSLWVIGAFFKETDDDAIKPPK